jgi:hypothetical protein
MFKSRGMRWARHVSCMGKMRNAYQILVGRTEGKSHLEDLGCRWEDIKMDLRDIGLEGVNWIYLAQDRDWWWALVNIVMNLRVS